MGARLVVSKMAKNLICIKILRRTNITEGEENFMDEEATSDSSESMPVPADLLFPMRRELNRRNNTSNY